VGRGEAGVKEGAHKGRSYGHEIGWRGSHTASCQRVPQRRSLRRWLRSLPVNAYSWRQKLRVG